MNSTLEHDGKRAWETHTLGEPVVLYEAEDGVGMLPAGKVVSICAWCDPDKTLTKKLEAAGYIASHGLCKACSDKMRARFTSQRQSQPISDAGKEAV